MYYSCEAWYNYFSLFDLGMCTYKAERELSGFDAWFKTEYFYKVRSAQQQIMNKNSLYRYI